MACDGRATCGRLVKYWPEAENLSQAMTAVEAEAKARVEAEAEAMAETETETETETDRETETETDRLTTKGSDNYLQGLP